MPPAITHSLVGAAAASVFANKKIPARFWVLSIICPLIPDLDVIGYQFFYIPLFHVFGHRGFFHSLFFALLSSLVIVGIFFRKEQFLLKPWWFFVLYFFLLMSSHSLLDAFTVGGTGIAFLSPFWNKRFFFPWTPIEISPLSIGAFFSGRGLSVLKSEMLWIWLPLFPLVFLIKIIGKMMASERKRSSN